MTTLTQSQNNFTGALLALVAAMCFSFNEMAVKFVSDEYALHQVVFIRALIGLATFFALIMPLNGGWIVLRTRRPGMHLLRGVCVVIANSCLYLGLASLPLADAVAIYFVLPLIIAVLSILFLGETVGPRRWIAIVVGFIGVLVIVKPGTTAFQIASVLPALAAFFYASLHIITRHIGGTESAATMSFYILLTYILFSAVVGLMIGDGRYAGMGHPALEFLLRAWAPVRPGDWPLILMMGVTGVFGGFLIGQAYRLSEAAFAAPFEYVSMVLAIFWGVTVFGTWPDATVWIGITLILGSGLYLLWREVVNQRQELAQLGRRGKP